MEFTNKSCNLTLTGHTNTVFSLLNFKNGEIVSGSWDSTIIVWNLNEKTSVATFKEHYGSVFCSCESEENDAIISCSDDTYIKVWQNN